MIDAGLAIIAASAGFIGYKVLSKDAVTSVQPAKAQKPGLLGSWFQTPDQPATGNGSPNTDQTGHDIADVVKDVSKFGTSLLQYFGTSQDNKSSGGGTSTGGPTNSYGSYFDPAAHG